MPTGQSPTANSIIVGNCISCEGLVRVSAKTKANADVRCPHCQQTFPLARLLESAVPEVEIVQPESSPTAATKATAATTAATATTDLYIDKTSETGKDAAGKFVVPSQLAKGARRRKSSRRGSSRSSSHRSDSDSSSRDGRGDSDSRSGARTHASQEVDETTINNSRNGSWEQSRDSSEHSGGDRQENHSGSHRSTRHRDMRADAANAAEPNPVVTVLKVFAGGAMALPIAYLIVMWVFSQDPLGIGQTLGDKVPFVVPAALRAETEEAPESPKKDETPGFDINDSGYGFNIGSEALEGFNR